MTVIEIAATAAASCSFLYCYSDSKPLVDPPIHEHVSMTYGMGDARALHNPENKH